MNQARSATRKWDSVLFWTARLSSLAVNSVFLLILILALTNEDKPQGAAIPVLAFLVLAMVSSFAAWRWTRAGSMAVLVSAVCLGLAAYFASRTYGPGPHLLAPLLYAGPYLIAGSLFLIGAKRDR